MGGSRFHLTFPERLSQEPVIHRLGQRFGLVTTIRRASIDDRAAWVILEIDGPDDRVREAVDWLGEQDVHIERIDGGKEGEWPSGGSS
ncbi:MAG TPA: NIL domain-containing protein [Actinomycetota bacterium]|nr:NIL domain-containing protein [Actinomycetota bacterium]